jgi:hypothetical protein
MNILRRAEVTLMAYLYRNRTIRLAKKRTEFLKNLALSSGIVVLFMQSEYKIDRLISANE